MPRMPLLPPTASVIVQAIGDDQAVTDGVMNGSTGVLTSATGKFNAVDVGKLCRVAGAGAAGADLWTTITSYQSATQVTLATVSATAVSGATVTWGTDNYAAFQAAVDTAAAIPGGALVWLAGKTYGLSRPVVIPPNLASTLELSGYCAKIRLYQNNATPRFIDCGKNTDYDTVQNIRVRGFTVDANNTGGKHHVVIGTYQAGSFQVRLNVAHVLVEDVTTINVPVDSTQTNYRLNVFFVPASTPYDTLTTVTDVVVRRCRFQGGAIGVSLSATLLNSNQQQLITLTGAPTGGTFTLSYGGQTTTGIAYNAAAGTVQTALQALSSIGANNCTITGANGGPFTFVAAGALAGMNIALLGKDGSGLTGGTAPTVTVAGQHAVGDYPNCALDQVVIEDCWHSLMTVQTTGWGSSNFQIGSRGFGGSGRISKCYGQFSGDSGIEVNGLTDLLVENCVVEDAWTEAYFFNNYAPPLNASAQRVVWKNCIGRRWTVTNAADGKGWVIKPQLSAPAWTQTPAQAVIRDCSWHQNQNNLPVANPGSSIYIQDAFNVDIQGFWSFAEGFTYNSSSTAFPCAIYFNLTGSNTTAIIRVQDAYVGLGGTVSTGAGGIQWNAIQFAGTSGSNTYNLAIDGVDVDFLTAITNGTGSESCRAVAIGNTSGGGITIGGSIRNYRCLHSTNDGIPLHIYFATGAIMTLRAPFTVTQCDFSTRNSGLGIFFNGTSVAASVRAYGNRWATSDATVAVGAISVAGSPFAYQALKGVDERVLVNGGTVSLIEHSVDGTTWTTTGVTAGECYLVAGEQLRVTYTVAPTMTRIPVR